MSRCDFGLFGAEESEMQTQIYDIGDRLWGLKSRSAADSSLKQSVDSRGEDPQGSDTQRSVMAADLRSVYFPVDPEYVDQSLDEAARG